MPVKQTDGPQIVLYNLKELRESADFERENNVIGKERIDRLEIEQLFRNRLEKKSPQSKDKKTFEELINIVDPAISEEHRIIIQEHLETFCIMNCQSLGW